MAWFPHYRVCIAKLISKELVALLSPSFSLPTILIISTPLSSSEPLLSSLSDSPLQTSTPSSAAHFPFALSILPPSPLHTPSFLSSYFFVDHREGVCRVVEGVGQSALVSQGSATERSQHRGIKRTHWRAHFCTASSYNALPFPSVTHTHTYTHTEVHVNWRMCMCRCAYEWRVRAQSHGAARFFREQG